MARWVRLIDTAPASRLYLTHVQSCAAKGDVVKLLANLFCSGFFSFFDPVSSARQTFTELPLSLADDSNFLLVLEQSQRLESAQLATALVQGEAGRVQLLTHGRLSLNLDVWEYLTSCIARDRDLLRACYPELVWLSIRKSLENVLEKSDESRFSFQLMFYNTTPCTTTLTCLAGSVVLPCGCSASSANAPPVSRCCPTRIQHVCALSPTQPRVSYTARRRFLSLAGSVVSYGIAVWSGVSRHALHAVVAAI